MCDVLGYINSMESTHLARFHFRSKGKLSPLFFSTLKLIRFPTPKWEQLLTVGIHELFHLAVGLICGGQVVSICIDPNDGGATHIMGLMRQTPRIPRDPYAMPTFAQAFWSASAVMTLGAGYFGSSVVGFLFVVSFEKGRKGIGEEIK